jgi:hypothetical protein
MHQDTPRQLGEAELDQLALQVDEQFAALQRELPSNVRGIVRDTLPDAPAQRALIEQATAQPFESFWQRYRLHLRTDLCQPGGLMHDQWQRYRDVESKSMVRNAYPLVAAMGIPMGSFEPVVVAASVFVLNVLAKAGIAAICEERPPA